jgi:hypothetical protein
MLAGKDEIATHQLRAMFQELVSHFGNKNSVDWTYANGKKARAVIVPKVKGKVSFMKQAEKLQWVESVLEHLAGGTEVNDKEDAVKCLVYCLGKKPCLIYLSFRGPWPAKSTKYGCSKRCGHECNASANYMQAPQVPF